MRGGGRRDLALEKVGVSNGRALRGEPPSLPCACSRPHLAVHLRQELVQKFLPVLLLSAHLGHQFLHHVVQLLGGGVKLDPAHFGRQSALICFLPENSAGARVFLQESAPSLRIPHLLRWRGRRQGGSRGEMLTTSISISRCSRSAFSFSSLSRPWYSTWGPTVQRK